MSTRQFWVFIRRYAGLAMTAFLVIVGVTGSLLAFYSELEHWINPQFYAVSRGNEQLDPVTLIERAESLAPHAQVESIWLEPDVSHVAVSPRIDPATGRPYDINYDQIILNPYTGEELGRRTWGAISQGMINLMPFIYRLHYALVLDEIGIWILGITALVWTLDCFIGFYLTLPMAKKKSKSGNVLLSGKNMESRRTRSRSFWQRWLPAWQIKWRGSAHRINFDLHRAGGLW